MNKDFRQTDNQTSYAVPLTGSKLQYKNWHGSGVQLNRIEARHYLVEKSDRSLPKEL